MVPVNSKSSESLNVFKSKINYWTPNHCPCRISKTYIGQVGFVNCFCLSPLYAELVCFLKIEFQYYYLKLIKKYLIYLYSLCHITYFSVFTKLFVIVFGFD